MAQSVDAGGVVAGTADDLHDATSGDEGASPSPTKYVSVQSCGAKYFLRDDGVVERRAPHRNRLLHRHLPPASPWTMLSCGGEGQESGVRKACEYAWLRADGAVDVITGERGGPTQVSPYEQVCLPREQTLLSDFTHTVAPPPGVRYIAVAGGAFHVSGGGGSVLYLLRDDGAVDRCTTTATGHPPWKPSLPNKRTAPTLRTLTPAGGGGKYVAVSCDYYTTHMVRDDGSVDVYKDTGAVTGGYRLKEESEGGRLVCTLAAGGGRYVGVSAHGVDSPSTDQNGRWHIPGPVVKYLLRADGRADYTAAGGCSVAGTVDFKTSEYVAAACILELAALLRRDGAVDVRSSRRTLTISAPPGCSYVDVSAFPYIVRSDGVVDELHSSTLWPGDREGNTRFATVVRSMGTDDPPEAAGGCCVVL